MPPFESILSKKDTFIRALWGPRSLKIWPKPASCLIFPTKLLATSTSFIASILKKVSLKLQGLLKFKHFDS